MAPPLASDVAPPNSLSPGRLCAAFVDALHVSGASISVFGRDGQQSTICATDSISARGEALQFELGEGPHWDALQSGVPTLSPDISAAMEHRWPLFAAAAYGIGMSAVFAFPMKMGAASVGVVDLYSARPRLLDPPQVSLASSMANRAAAPAARQAMLSADDPTSAEHEMAPAMRREVHQATGMVQAQLDVSATDALAQLRAHAYTNNRPIEDVARDVVNRRLDFSTFTD
jgi:hypothetical protein